MAEPPWQKPAPVRRRRNSKRPRHNQAPPDLLALGEALAQLAALDEAKARIVELRHFGGLTCEEIGGVLGVHAKKVTRDLRLAEAWLRGRIREPS